MRKILCGLDQLEQQLATFGVLEIDRQTLLTAIVLFHRQIRRLGLATIGNSQRPIRIALHFFDLDHFGAEVGQHGARSRNEDVLRELNHAHTFEHCIA